MDHFFSTMHTYISSFATSFPSKELFLKVVHFIVANISKDNTELQQVQSLQVNQGSQ